MIIVLALAAWFSILLAVLGLCAAASRGDSHGIAAMPLEQEIPPATRMADWESAEHLAVYAHAARSHPTRQTRNLRDVSALHKIVTL
jgi:hypothetical protein